MHLLTLTRNFRSNSLTRSFFTRSFLSSSLGHRIPYYWRQSVLTTDFGYSDPDRSLTRMEFTSAHMSMQHVDIQACYSSSKVMASVTYRVTLRCRATLRVKATASWVSQVLAIWWGYKVHPGRKVHPQIRLGPGSGRNHMCLYIWLNHGPHDCACLSCEVKRSCTACLAMYHDGKRL